MTMLLKLWNSGMKNNLSGNSNRGKKRVTRLVVAVVLAFGKTFQLNFCYLFVYISKICLLSSDDVGSDSTDIGHEKFGVLCC